MNLPGESGDLSVWQPGRQLGWLSSVVGGRVSAAVSTPIPSGPSSCGAAVANPAQDSACGVLGVEGVGLAVQSPQPPVGAAGLHDLVPGAV